jgi:hypothetical protein
MLEKEKIIREQRLAEAMDKNYMGLEGKFGIILKNLGKPIISQGAANYEMTEWKDMYDLQEEEMLPEEDPDAPIREIGRIFDGLKFGYHLEITYLKEGTMPVNVDEYHTTYEEASKVLKVNYRGFLVYLEAEGELHTFKPSAEWEDIILTIYQSAVKLQNTHRFTISLEAKEEDKRKKLSFLERLREKWGI